MTTLPELRKICESATPGWGCDYCPEEHSWKVHNGWDVIASVHGADNAKYISEFHPARVLQILEDYEAMKAALERIECGLTETAWIGPDETVTEYCSEVLSSLRLGKEGGGNE